MPKQSWTAIENPCAEVAAERDRLKAERDRLREALEKIASCESRVNGDVVSIARAAIAKAEAQQ